MLCHTFKKALRMIREHEKPQPVKLAYSVFEVAEILGISTDKTYELIRANALPHKRLGRRIIIPSQRFYEWLNSTESWESFDAS